MSIKGDYSPYVLYEMRVNAEYVVGYFEPRPAVGGILYLRYLSFGLLFVNGSRAISGLTECRIDNLQIEIIRPVSLLVDQRLFMDKEARKLLSGEVPYRRLS